MLASDPDLHHNPESMRLSERGRCPACSAVTLEPVIEIKGVPTNSCLMLDSRAEAEAYPRGDIDIVFCGTCGFMFNQAFDPLLTEYSERYEPTQAYSPTFQKFHKELASRLVNGLDLHGKMIVEVGCGQGEFLHLLCRLGGNRGVGFDPCLDDRREDVVQDRAQNVRLIGDFFSDKSITGLTADFLCSKMTLEHIPAVDRFADVVEQVARQSAHGMQIFIQIPESERILADCAFWDIYYEHCNYFTECSLAGLFARRGFAIDSVSREYDGQYLNIVARYDSVRRDSDKSADVLRLKGMVREFSAAFAREVKRWNDFVRARAGAGGRIAIWGSGSKGVSFLAALGDRAMISHVVDINPHRQGKFMVGSGHPIVGPDDLKSLKPTTVIIMNKVYEREIAAMLAARGLSPEIVSL